MVSWRSAGGQLGVIDNISFYITARYLQAVPFILRSLHGGGHRDHAQRGAAHRRALNQTDQNISSLLR